MEKSRTQQALDLLRNNPGMSQYRACQLVGLKTATLSRAVAAMREKRRRAELLAQTIVTAEHGGYFEPSTPVKIPPPTKTSAAIALMKKNPEMNVEDAARRIGMHSTVLYAALRRRRHTQGMRCKHCDALLPYLKAVINSD